VASKTTPEKKAPIEQKKISIGAFFSKYLKNNQTMIFILYDFHQIKMLSFSKK